MFRVKICGVTRPEDVELVLRAGGDAIGLNFYPASKRHVSVEQAATLASRAGDAWKVGVFVNARADEIREIAAKVGLTAVQLHGDEPPEMVAELADLCVIKAFRWQGGSEIDHFLEQCQASENMPRAVLVDAHRPGEYGGTGDTADWKEVAQWRQTLSIPLILAGGLTGHNVAAAIAAVAPDAVDTASGVESAPGGKDAEKVEAFVKAAAEALGSQSG